MKKKEKTDLEKLEHIVSYLKERVVQKGIASAVDSYNGKEDESDFVKCSYARDGYTVEVKFGGLISSIDIEFGFLYPNCDTLFSLDDVHNALEINDFEEYFVDANMEDETSQEKAVEDLLYILEKFDYDIKKAGDSVYFASMLAMHDEDKALYDSDDVKIRNLIKITVLEHKMRKTKSEKDKQAYLKFAKKQADTVGVDNKTKRYIKYLEAGYAIPDNKDDTDEEIKSTKTTLVVYAICGIIGLLTVFLIFALDRAALSQKGTVLTNDLWFVVFGTGVGGGALGYLLSRIFGTKLILKLTPEIERDYALEQRKKRFDDLGFFEGLFQKYVAPVLSVIIIVIGISLICSAVCITPTQVIDHNLIFSNKYDYEDTTVYMLKGFSDDDDEYYEYDYPCYAFAVKSDDYIIATSEIKSEKQQKALDDVFKAHNITPIEIDQESSIQN